MIWIFRYFNYIPRYAVSKQPTDCQHPSEVKKERLSWQWHHNMQNNPQVSAALADGKTMLPGLAYERTPQHKHTNIIKSLP
jgi:hypothetical protein